MKGYSLAEKYDRTNKIGHFNEISQALNYILVGAREGSGSERLIEST